MNDVPQDPGPTIDPPDDPSTGDVLPGSGTSVGDTVGPFKIIRTLGEGGFGVVYLAEQTEPVRRMVALKVIKPGMDTRSVIARFEAERQALEAAIVRDLAARMGVDPKRIDVTGIAPA